MLEEPPTSDAKPRDVSFVPKSAFPGKVTPMLLNPHSDEDRQKTYPTGVLETDLQKGGPLYISFTMGDQPKVLMFPNLDRVAVTSDGNVIITTETGKRFHVQPVGEEIIDPQFLASLATQNRTRLGCLFGWWPL